MISTLIVGVHNVSAKKYNDLTTANAAVAESPGNGFEDIRINYWSLGVPRTKGKTINLDIDSGVRKER